MGDKDKVRTRSVSEISDIIKGVLSSAELKTFINDAVKLSITECIKQAISEATKDLKKEILDLKKVIIDLKNKTVSNESETENKHVNEMSVSNQNKEINKVVAGTSKSFAKPSADCEEWVEKKSGKTYRDAMQGQKNNKPYEKDDLNPLHDEGGEFQVVRRRRPRTVIIGNKADESLIVAEKQGYLHLWRLSPETKEDDVVNYCQRMIPNLKINCERLNARGDYSSFKLTTGETVLNDMMKPEFWPAGTAIDRFFNRRPNPPKLT